MTEAPGYRWRFPAGRLRTELGISLTPEQERLAEQPEGLALTLLRLPDTTHVSSDDETTLHTGEFPLRTEGEFGLRNAVLPVVLDFGSDHSVSHPHDGPFMASDWLDNEYGHGWSSWPGHVGQIDPTEIINLDDNRLHVRRIWDCWPINDAEAEVFTQAAQRAWDGSPFALWSHYHDLKRDVEMMGVEDWQANEDFEAVHRELFEPSGVVRYAENPEERLMLPDDLDLTWQRLLQSSIYGWDGLQAGVPDRKVPFWRLRERPFCPWY